MKRKNQDLIAASAHATAALERSRRSLAAARADKRTAKLNEALASLNEAVGVVRAQIEQFQDEYAALQQQQAATAKTAVQVQQQSDVLQRAIDDFLLLLLAIPPARLGEHPIELLRRSIGEQAVRDLFTRRKLQPITTRSGKLVLAPLGAEHSPGLGRAGGWRLN